MVVECGLSTGSISTTRGVGGAQMLELHPKHMELETLAVEPRNVRLNLPARRLLKKSRLE